MLVISRKAGESIHIGNNVVLRVSAIRGGRVQIAIEAPREVAIRRSELAVVAENPPVEPIAYKVAVA